MEQYWHSISTCTEPSLVLIGADGADDFWLFISSYYRSILSTWTTTSCWIWICLSSWSFNCSM